MSRPPEITKEWADGIAPSLADMYKNGESLAEVCAELGICKNSYYKACKISEEFMNSDTRGKQLSEAWWSKLGRAGAAGKVSIQPTVWQFNMKNRFDWRDKVDSTNDHTVKGEIDNHVTVEFVTSGQVTGE